MSAPFELVIIPVTPPGHPFNSATPDDLERRFGDRGRRRRDDAPATPEPLRNGMRRDQELVTLRLFVSPDSMSCARAMVALEDIRRQFPGGAFELEIVDVSSEVVKAEEQRILFTPTLLMLDRGGRSTRVLGDLSNVTVLVELLRAAGVEPI